MDGTNLGKRLAARSRLLLLTFVKLVTDLPFLTRRPVARFESLDGWRYPTYLLTAFASVGRVSVRTRDLNRARHALGWKAYLTRVSLDTEVAHAPRLNFRSYEPHRKQHQASRDMNVVCNYYRDAAPHELHAPYFAHPDFYRTGLHRRCRGMRDVERSIRVFFAGTCNDSSYTTQFRFNILTRSAIFRFVNQNFDVVNLAQSGPRSGIVVSVTERPDQDMMKHTLRLDEYLEVVARSDFFLCMPGFRIPHSHNLIEAMSVGSIPILNYTAYVQPRLAPGRDCLAFNSLDELATVLNRALSMTEDEIVTMRTHVTDFYDRELDPTAFARRVLALDPDVNTLLVNDESGA